MRKDDNPGCFVKSEKSVAEPRIGWFGKLMSRIGFYDSTPRGKQEDAQGPHYERLGPDGWVEDMQNAVGISPTQYRHLIGDEPYDHGLNGPIERPLIPGEDR
ncbi:MAG: hypothetical protein CL811_01210 [Colwelliaceae bacterium]|nr:hypothetical protein [Colwelliaceae bacterium]|tara:strand:+ start:1679 stop:1984 length:306 start_codon:yes stop_codon:yes gene_type:complete